MTESDLLDEVAKDKRLIERTLDLADEIDFNPGDSGPYDFEARKAHGGIFVQGNYFEPDIYSGKIVKQYTRKWLLSPEMTDSEIVSTIFKLCITSMEHRTREWFMYKRKRIFGPHFDVEDLVKLCDTRENAGGRG